MSPKNSCALVVFFLLGCSSEEPTKPPQKMSPPVPVATSTPAPKAAALPALISQDEADAKAAAAIKKENADAELEKLKKELNGG